MSGEIRALVDRRWAEYGFDRAPDDADGRRSRPLRQLLRR
jgi:hypothetical protein